MFNSALFSNVRWMSFQFGHLERGGGQVGSWKIKDNRGQGQAELNKREVLLVTCGAHETWAK